MNTVRACAVIGLVLSLGFASGCSSDSKPGNTDGSVKRDGNRDTPFNPNADTTSGEACVFNGTTYQQGQSFTINCVRYTCQGSGNVTSSGSPCTDAGPTTSDGRTNRDTAPGTDTPSPGDVPPTPDVTGNRDVSPAEAGVSEAGKRDVFTPLDVAGKDAEENKDLFVPEDATPVTPDLAVAEDLAPPTPDVAPPTPDVAPPTKCSYGGQLYNPGDEFACDCNTCICTSSGAIRSVTSNVCNVDAG